MSQPMSQPVSQPVSSDAKPTCRIVPAEGGYTGKQGLNYTNGISTETVGSTGICMHRQTIPPGGRAKAHLHAHHETAIYMIDGEVEMWFGERLEQHCVLRSGEFLYIPAGMPHLPTNRSDRPATAVLARTDPSEQESVVLRPDLEALAPA